MLWATLRQLQSKDARMRRQAAEKLGDAKKRRASKALAAALKDPDSWVRQEAAEALGKIGDARAVEPLVEALTDSDGGGGGGGEGGVQGGGGPRKIEIAGGGLAGSVAEAAQE